MPASLPPHDSERVRLELEILSSELRAKEAKPPPSAPGPGEPSSMQQAEDAAAVVPDEKGIVDRG